MMQKNYQPSQSSDKYALTKQKEYFSRYQLYALAYVHNYIIYMDAMLLYKQKVFFKIFKALFPLYISLRCTKSKFITFNNTYNWA